jgi:hypothetical protein
MTRDTKAKTGSRTLWQYLQDEYIFFVRNFEISSDLTMQEVAQNMQAMELPEPSGCNNLKSSRIVVNVNSNDVDRAFFNLDLEYHSSGRYGGGYKSSAHASGRIHTENGQCYLTGTVTVSGTRFWVSVVGAVITVGLFNRFQPTVYGGWFFLLIAGLLGLEWYQMYRDRNQLLKMIEDATKQEDPFYAEEKLKREEG